MADPLRVPIVVPNFLSGAVFPSTDQTAALWIRGATFSIKENFSKLTETSSDDHLISHLILWRRSFSLSDLPHCVPGQLYRKELILFPRSCSLICILISVTFGHHRNDCPLVSWALRGHSAVVKPLLRLTLVQSLHYPGACVILSQR